jgi:hypothetical protein
MSDSNSPVLRALMQLTAEHGPLDREELLARLKRQPAECLKDKHGQHVAPTMNWVSRAMYYLRATGRVRRQGSANGRALWVEVPKAEQGEAMSPARQARHPRLMGEAAAAKEAPTGPVVPPRQINIFAGTYVPRLMAPARAGAMDYASLPSLHMGHRRAFRAEAAGGTS